MHPTKPWFLTKPCYQSCFRGQIQSSLVLTFWTQNPWWCLVSYQDLGGSNWGGGGGSLWYVEIIFRKYHWVPLKQVYMFATKRSLTHKLDVYVEIIFRKYHWVPLKQWYMFATKRSLTHKLDVYVEIIFRKYHWVPLKQLCMFAAKRSLAHK